jgi:hypothetical protein
MKFGIYGRFQLEVRRKNDAWVAYRLDPGKRARMNDLVIPATLTADEIATYLDDMFHELSGPGRRIELL